MLAADRRRPEGREAALWLECTLLLILAAPPRPHRERERCFLRVDVNGVKLRLTLAAASALRAALANPLGLV